MIVYRSGRFVDWPAIWGLGRGKPVPWAADHGIRARRAFTEDLAASASTKILSLRTTAKTREKETSSPETGGNRSISTTFHDLFHGSIVKGPSTGYPSLYITRDISLLRPCLARRVPYHMTGGIMKRFWLFAGCLASAFMAQADVVTVDEHSSGDTPVIDLSTILHEWGAPSDTTSAFTIGGTGTDFTDGLNIINDTGMTITSLQLYAYGTV